jgi:hypothetical protein
MILGYFNIIVLVNLDWFKVSENRLHFSVMILATKKICQPSKLPSPTYMIMINQWTCFDWREILVPQSEDRNLGAVKAEAINLWALPMPFVVSLQPQNVGFSINHYKLKM